jgi:spermidine synthase
VVVKRKADEAPLPGRYQVTFGEVELLRDLDRPNGWLLSMRGVPQSFVDLDDPTYLDFEYVRLMADVIDILPEGPLDALHIGGGACTIPRYIAAIRPGSRQIVIEPDGALVDLVRSQLRLRAVPGLRVRVLDGRAAVPAFRDAWADLVILDAFSGAAMPLDLATAEYMADVARVLRRSGTLLINIADGKGLAFARRMAATVCGAFRHAVLLAEPAIMRGRRFGNLIMAASSSPLPVDTLASRAAAGLPQARCVYGEALTNFVAGAAPMHDGDSVAVPVPPPSVFGEPAI